MANNPKKKKTDDQAATPPVGDPLFNLHHAQAEAELAKKNGGLGPTTNVYVTNAEEANIEEGMTPHDSQGFTRGEPESDVIGTNAGDHK